MTKLKQKLDAGQNATLLIVGDSRSRAEPGRWPQLLMWAIAGNFTASLRVVLVERNVFGVGTVSTICQSGAGMSPQTLTVIVDSIPGATTLDRADTRDVIGAQYCDEMIVLLGVNDSVKHYVDGDNTFRPVDAYINLRALCLWIYQTHGCGVSLMTECWNGESLWAAGKGLSAYRDAARRVANLNGFKIIDGGALFDNNYNGTGFAGQNGWFTSPDPVHWNANAEASVAAICLPALGF